MPRRTVAASLRVAYATEVIRAFSTTGDLRSPSTNTNTPPRDPQPQPQPTSRLLYPPVRVRALSERRRWGGGVITDSEHHLNTGADADASSALEELSPSGSSTASAPSTMVLHRPAAPLEVLTEDSREVAAFLSEVEHQVENARFIRNQAMPYPDHPDELVPEFRRVKRHTRMEVVGADPDFPVFPRTDQHVQLPPPAKHPWVDGAVMGPHITHGDGQIGIVGEGSIGFEDGEDTFYERRRRAHWKGLQHHSILRSRLPQLNGKVLQDMVVKHSFELTGKGIFATRDIKAGETIMIVHSTAQNLGVKGELQRLEQMCADLLLTCYESRNEELFEFLYTWVLSGQPSSLLERWPETSTARVLEAIGGTPVLDRLQLHTLHIARIAAIMDMNSFLVENYYAERKGMAYFPEAGLLNHSCVPNATYDIVAEHTFRETEYYVDEATEATEREDLSSSSTAAAAYPTDTEANMVVDKAQRHNGPSPPSCISKEESEVTTVVPATRNVANCFGLSAKYVSTLPDLTEAAAPGYLFCCRASKDIRSGEEVLISYVPPLWSFDNRQYVLHDRYKFWCKCPKCAPTLDSKYARNTQLIIVVIFLSVLLQLFVLHTRERRMAAEADMDEWRQMTDDERRDILLAQGIDTSTYDAKMYPVTKRKGFFEMMAAAKRREANRLDGDAGMVETDPYPMAGRM